MKPSSSRIKRLYSRIFKFRTWSDWTRVESSYIYLLQLLKKLFIIKPVKAAEPFDDMLRRLKLTEEDLLNRQKGFLRACVIMLTVMMAVLSYTFYQIIYGNISAAVLSGVVSLIALALAFRYHFWYIQIQQRRLGCSFADWFKASFMRKSI